MLGKMYAQGNHVKCDIEKAIKYLELAAAKEQKEAQVALADLAKKFATIRRFEETQVAPETPQTID